MSDLCFGLGRREGKRVLVLLGCIWRMGKRDLVNSVEVSYVRRGCLISLDILRCQFLIGAVSVYGI